MIISSVNIALCVVGMGAGAFTFVKHLNGFGSGKTLAVDAWLVCVGTLAWSVWLFGAIELALEHHALNAELLGLAGAEVFGNALLLIYWLGTLLQVQKHCIRNKLNKRKQERQNAK